MQQMIHEVLTVNQLSASLASRVRQLAPRRNVWRTAVNVVEDDER